MSSLHRGGDTYSEGITTLGHASEHDRAGHALHRDELLCPICVEPLQDAFVTTCGHTFCYACISTHLKHRRNCPSCFNYLTTDHIHPNFLLNKILSQAALKAPGPSGNTVARSVEQALALAPGPVRARDLEHAIQLLQAHRHHVLQQEETSGLHLLLLLLQDARQRKAAALAEVHGQMSLLEQDMRAMTKQGSAANPLAAPNPKKRKLESGDTPSFGPGVQADEPGDALGRGQQLRVILNPAGGTLQQLQGQLQAAASAAISAGGSLHVHRLEQGMISSISIDRAFLPGLDAAGLAAAVQPTHADQAVIPAPTADDTAAAARHVTFDLQTSQANGLGGGGAGQMQAVQVAGNSNTVAAAALDSTTGVSAPVAGSAQHQLKMGSPQQLSGAVMEPTSSRQVQGLGVAGLPEPFGLGRIQVKQPRRDDRSDMRDDDEAGEAGEQAELEMSTPTSTAFMPRRMFHVPAGGRPAASDMPRLPTGQARPQLHVKPEPDSPKLSTGPVPTQAAAGKHEVQLATGQADRPSAAGHAAEAAAATAEDPSALGVLRATKKRLMLTQYDDLQQVYMQLRQQQDAAGQEAGGQQQAGSRQAGVPRLGTASVLKQFGQVLNAVTSYSGMSAVAELPQAAYGGPASSFAQSASTRPTNSRSSSSNLVSCINFNLSEEVFAMCSAQRLFLWNYADVVSRAPAQQAASAHVINRTKLTGLAFSRHDQQLLAASDNEGTVYVYDAATQQMVMDIEVHDSRIWALDCVPSAAGQAVAGGSTSKCFASGSDDYTLRVWDVRDGNVCSTIDTRANVCSVRYCPWDPNYIAVGSAAHAVLIYDLRKAGGTAPALTSLAGHTKAVSYVRWSGPNEVVSASTDSSLRLWDVGRFISPGPATSTSSSEPPLAPPCVRTYTGHLNERHFVGLSVDRDLFAAGSENNEVVVYCKSLTSPSIRQLLPGGDSGGGAAPAGAAGAPAHRGSASGRTGQHFISSLTWRHTDRGLVVATSQGSIWVLALQ